MRGKILAASICSLAFAVLALTPNAVRAQQPASATLSGRVVDSAGAVIAGAQATITNRVTSSRRETTTNAEGVFVATNLAPGEYELRVQQTGFKTSIYSSIVLQVGQSENVNVTLDVGQPSITVTVSGEALDYGP